MSCTKCESYHQPIGPTYRRNSYGERLEYRCPNCGYSWSTPTADQVAADAALASFFREGGKTLDELRAELEPKH